MVEVCVRVDTFFAAHRQPIRALAHAILAECRIRTGIAALAAMLTVTGSIDALFATSFIGLCARACPFYAILHACAGIAALAAVVSVRRRIDTEIAAQDFAGRA